MSGWFGKGVLVVWSVCLLRRYLIPEYRDKNPPLWRFCRVSDRAKKNKKREKKRTSSAGRGGRGRYQLPGEDFDGEFCR